MWFFLAVLVLLLVGYCILRMNDWLTSDSATGYWVTSLLVIIISAVAAFVKSEPPSPYDWRYVCTQHNGRIEEHFVKVDGYEPHYFSTCVYDSRDSRDNKAQQSP
jgi:hypothetical protein